MISGKCPSSVQGDRWIRSAAPHHLLLYPVMGLSKVMLYLQDRMKKQYPSPVGLKPSFDFVGLLQRLIS